VDALRSKELQTLLLPAFRSGAFAQAVLPSSDFTCIRQGPFAPFGFPNFFTTTGLSDSRLQQSLRLLFPVKTSAGTPYRNGSPRYLDHSFDARSPLPPRDVLRLLLLIPSSQVIDFILYDRLLTSTSHNEAVSGSRLPALGLTSSRSQGYLPCSPQPQGGDRPASFIRLPLQRRSSLHVI